MFSGIRPPTNPPPAPPEFKHDANGDVVTEWYFNNWCGCYMQRPVPKS